MEKALWYYDDMRQIGVDFEDDDQVQSYDERQLATATDDNRLLDELAVTAGDVVADIGCGTGILAIEAARRVNTVHAVDVSMVMLNHARARARDNDLGNICFHHAGFLSVDLAENSFDLVTSKYALHHLPDLWKGLALHRLHRTLKPGWPALST